LHIWGPPALRNIIEGQLSFFRDEITYPIEYHATCPKKGLDLLLEDKSLAVYSFPLKHRVATTGFLFKEKPKLPNIKKEAIAKYDLSIREIVAIKDGANLCLDEDTIVPNENLVIPAPTPKSFAYCSDTAYNESVADVVKEVTLLYHESTFTEDFLQRAKKTMHSTAKQAALVAKKANVEKLILGHYSARYPDLSVFLDEARPVFSNTVLGKDLHVYEF